MLDLPRARPVQEAFERIEPEIRAVAEGELAVNLDISGAVATVLRALPGLLAFREQLEALKDIAPTRLDVLHDYSLALLHTHALHVSAVATADPIGSSATELFKIRAQLFCAARTLGEHGHVDLARVEKLRSGLGFNRLALDVNGLVQVFRESASTIGDKSAVTAEELDHAAELASNMIAAVAAKEQASAAIGATSRLRQQAFTLFTRAYSELRRAMSILRWSEADVDTLAPSLYAGRGGRKRRT